jgi:hypothetical protein
MKCLPQAAICETRADEGMRHALNGPAAHGAIEIDAPCDSRHAPLLSISQRLCRDDIVLLGPGHRPEDAR